MRIPNFDVALVEWAGSVIGKPFVWGETDCASLVRQSQAIVFGRDIFGDLPEWSTRFGALKALKDAGPIETVLRDVGLRPYSLGFAQTGDILLFPGEDDGLPRTAVVVTGKLIGTAPGEMVLPHSVHTASKDTTAWGIHE